MKISARFAEFGMTGALFWITQLAYVVFFHDKELAISLQSFIGNLGDYQQLWDSTAPEIKKVGGSLLTAVGLIGIFVTGLFLYLLGSYFFFFENAHFIKQLDRNSSWMDDMMKGCAGTVSNDYQQIRNEYDRNFFLFSIKKLRRRWQFSRQCKNLQSFLFSYIQVFCKNGSSEILSDNVHVWRVARAIGIIFFILCIQTLVLDFHGRSTFEQFASAAAFLVLGIYTTLRSYDRMCYSLFTMACATHHSHQKTVSPIPLNTNSPLG